MTYPVALARGRAVKLTGYVRTEGISTGYAGLWARVDGAGRTLLIDNCPRRGPAGV